jgi:hypothetical protein
MKSNESKISLPALLMVALGLIFILICFLMGMIYITKGNFVISIFVSLVPLLFFTGLVIVLYREKTKLRTRQNYDNFTLEYFAAGLYITLIFATFPILFHFIEVEFTLKNKIQKAGIEKVISINEMDLKYRGEVDDKIKLFKTGVMSDLNNYFLGDSSSKTKLKSALGEAVSFDRYQTNQSAENREDLETQVKNILSSKEKTLQEKYNLAEKDTAELVGQKNKIRKNFEKWDRVEVPRNYKQIDEIYDKYKALLQEKMPEFTHTRQSFEDIEMDRSIASLSNASAARILGTFAVVLVAHLFILSLYLLAKRYQYGGPIRKKHSNETNQGIKIK